MIARARSLIFLLSILAGSALLCSAPAYAAFQSRMGELLLSANQAHIQTDAHQTRIIILTGNVQVVYRAQHITADEIRINQKTKEIDAIGHVVFLAPTAKMEGDRIKLNTETNTGEIYNAYMESGQIQLQGTTIIKTGVDTFTATDGSYTACVTCPPGWSFSGNRIEAQLGAYAYIKNPIIRIGGVPILWLPYIVVPLKSERQSGLLFPAFENSSNSGFAFSESYFWAIDKSHDATFGWKNYANRGNKVLGQYRHTIGQYDRGVLDTTYMKDPLPAATPFSGVNPGSNLERYYIKYDQMYNLPDNFIERMNIYYVADIKYPLDFNTEVLGYGEPAAENRASLTKNTESTSSILEAGYYINMLHTPYVTDNRDAIHRAPEFNTYLVPQSVGLGNLQFQNEASYTNFQRNSTTFTYQYNYGTPPVYTNPLSTVDPNGVFNPDVDTYRSGQRFYIYPSLSYPFQVGVIDIQPTVGYNESHYYFQNTSPVSTPTQAGSATSNQPEAQRRFLRTQVSARTRMSHIYGDTEKRELNRYKHEIVPEISYSAIPWLQSTSHPFFGGIQDVMPFAARDIPVSDRDLLQFDYRDRLTERDVATVAITNRITRRKWVDNKPDYRQIASLRLSQSYDFYENYRSGIPVRQPYSDISSLLTVRLDNLEIDSFTQYYPYQNVAQTSSLGRLFDEHGNFFSLEYDKNYQLQAPQAGIQTYQLDLTSANENISLGGGLLTSYASFMASIQYGVTIAQLSSYVFGVNFRPPGNCWVLSLNYTMPFQAPANLGFSFNLLFDGNTAAPISKM